MKEALRRQARRLAKLAWWVVTPWRTPERVRLVRARLQHRASERAVAVLMDREAGLVAARKAGAAVPPPRVLDLSSDQDVVHAADLPAARVICPGVAPDEVHDSLSAARFCIGLLRGSASLRSRFPQALSAGASGAFARWLQDEGAAELGLSLEARVQLAALFSHSYAARARQMFLADERVRSVLPHGLTPVGQRALFEWALKFGGPGAGLQPEEIWWLFIEAAEEPQRELVLAYLFSPDWQREHPEGLTMFGRSAFAAWFEAAYGASGPWVEPSSWPQWLSPALQIRAAYGARTDWQLAHPSALANEPAAARLLEWLSHDELALPPNVREWWHTVPKTDLAAQLAAPGVNVIGHFCYPSGLRVSVESIVQGLRLNGVGVSLRDVKTDVKDDPEHVRFDGLELYDTTIIHTQPEPFFRQAYQRADLCERTPRTYRIAYWYWEFDSIPDAWVEAAKQVDEVWAATEFVASGLRKRLTIPVRTLFPGVKLGAFTKRNPAHFGLDATRFNFLFTFHMMSVMERKNPLGLIRAFKAAFNTDEPVNLVLKASFGDRHPDQIKQLHEAAAGSNITIIDQVYSPDEVLSLMDACDAYVSLHRSEGLGLTMAEAMLMGKPVIATNYSGNVDFTNDSNSLLVPFELVKLGRPIPPYDAESEWAEPSTDEAARLMRRVYADQHLARELGARAKENAEANLSPEAAGRQIAARLAEISALRRAIATN